MSIYSYKSNIIEIPTYNDGYFNLYRIRQSGIFPIEYLELITNNFPFKEKSVGDKLKYDLKERNVDIDKKIIISQEKSIDSLCVIEIGKELYHVLNSYHYTDEDGFAKTRLSLEKYNLVGV